MRKFVLWIVCFAAYSAHAQYWFGPKIGGHRTDFIYHEEEYTRDLFDVKEDYNYHMGFTVIYQATSQYSVQTELTFERISRELRDKNYEVPVFSKSVYNYINFPLQLRYNFGSKPTHFYLSGGPKLSFLLGGSGRIELEEFEEFRGGPLEYRLVFNQKNSNGNDRMAMPEANRVQFGLAFGAGMYFDLISGERLSIDLRYAFGHSNVGFNDNPDFNNFATYSENYRYRQNVFSVSVAYLFEYDMKEQRHGASTIRESNKRKTSVNQKRRRK